MMKYIVTQILFCLFLICNLNAQEQRASIRGRVTTSDGKAAPYVNVTIKETRKTIMSDENGFFVIHASKACTCSILITYAGLKQPE